MLVKVIVLLLVFMVALALFGRLRFPRVTAKCPACGRHRIGRGPCPCGKA
jgi:hypothetical protein